MRKKKKKSARKRVFRRRIARKKKEVDKKEPKKIKQIKVLLVGIGGGGGSIVSEIAQRVKRASFFAANTDSKALRRISAKVTRFHFGQDLTHGLGTGMNPELGEEAARREKERIKKILQDQDFVILIACLGGGLGSGAAPIFAKISKGLGNLTYGIFTLPFKFEGAKKMDIARKSLEKVKTRLNAFSIIPNERVFQVIERTAPLKKALSAINKKLADSIRSLIDIIYAPGLINIDFADLKTIFEGRGRLTYLNSIEIGKEDKEAIEKVINSPLYLYGIDGAKGVMLNISGQKNLSLTQVDQVSRVISGRVHKEAKIIFGISGVKKNSKIKVTLLATGCSQKKTFKKPKKKPKKVSKIKRKKVKQKKIKVKVSQSNPPVSLKKVVPIQKKEKERIRVRKNALEVKKDKEREEAEIISKEKFWETPSFLKKKMTQGQ